MFIFRFLAALISVMGTIDELRSSCGLAKVTEALLSRRILAILTPFATRFLVGSPLALLKTVAIIAAIVRLGLLALLLESRLPSSCQHVRIP